ncbi:MFS transporter [Sphingorhabdus sp. SMR4y]|uniref:MFS transporter n=1 Tax=Sphingorhabdus sp. SMR4y TaxID=2584094 RepID=UPI000B5C6129|nr:MFS transporter [Sphingorhabdus sp. SMR4y]ASK89318.1 melibiose carrier protein [Sphingorhabdus sp. SMR4y]
MSNQPHINPDGTSDPKLPMSVCLGFGVGTVGVSIMLNGVTTYFPAFMTTVLGKDAEIAGYLLMASKLYDAVADFVIGSMSDKTRSKWGRRRPYLLAGALVSALSFLAIFSPPAMDDDYISLYMFLALILYSTGYSLFNVPYMAMPSEMTGSKYQRSRLLSFRTLFVSLGQILAMAGTAALISWGGADANGYMIMGWVMALVIGSAMFASFLGTAKAPHIEASKEPEPAISWDSLKQIYRNKPFVAIVAAKIFQFLAFASLATTGLLFKLNVLLIGYTGQMQLALAQNIATAVSMPLWLWMERRLGKRNAYIIGLLMMAIGSLSWLTTDSSITTWGIIWRGVISGLGSGGMILLSISMFVDSLAYDREVTGLRREGLLSSVIAIIEKTTFALGVAAVGAYLSFSNYLPTTGGEIVEQPESAVNALYFCFTILPVFFFACNAICISFYKIGGRYPDVKRP